MHDEDELSPIYVNQGLLLVSLYHMKRNTTMNVDTKVRLVEAWEMTLLAKY